MTNPNYYEEDYPADRAAGVLEIAGKVIAGMVLVTVAASAMVAYVSARAGEDARDRLNGAVEDAGRAIRRAGEQVTGTARAALDAAASAGEQSETLPAATSQS